MAPIADLKDFVHDHRSHSILTGDATKTAWNRYLLTVECPCGVVFERWVTGQRSQDDLVWTGLLAFPN